MGKKEQRKSCNMTLTTVCERGEGWRVQDVLINIIEQSPV